MNTNMHTFSVTDLRHRTSHVLEEVTKHGMVYLLSHSKPKAAVVDIAYLQALQEAYEDYLDMLEYDRTVSLARVPLTKHNKEYAKKA